MTEAGLPGSSGGGCDKLGEDRSTPVAPATRVEGAPDVVMGASDSSGPASAPVPADPPANAEVAGVDSAGTAPSRRIMRMRDVGRAKVDMDDLAGLFPPLEKSSNCTRIATGRLSRLWE